MHTLNGTMNYLKLLFKTFYYYLIYILSFIFKYKFLIFSSLAILIILLITLGYDGIFVFLLLYSVGLYGWFSWDTLTIPVLKFLLRKKDRLFLAKDNFHSADLRIVLKLSIQYCIFLFATAFLLFELVIEPTNVVMLVQYLAILNIVLLPLSFVIVPTRWMIDAKFIEDSEKEKIELSAIKWVEYFIHLSPIILVVYIKHVWSLEGIEGVLLFLLFMLFFIGITSFLTIYLYTKFSIKRNLTELAISIDENGNGAKTFIYSKKISAIAVVVIYLLLTITPALAFLRDEIKSESSEYVLYPPMDVGIPINFSFEYPAEWRYVSLFNASWKIIPPARIEYRLERSYIYDPTTPSRGSPIERYMPYSDVPSLWQTFESPSFSYAPFVGFYQILKPLDAPFESPPFSYSPFTVHILIWRHHFGNGTNYEILRNEIQLQDDYYSGYSKFGKVSEKQVTIDGTIGYEYDYTWKWLTESEGTSILKNITTKTIYSISNIIRSSQGGKEYKYQLFSTKVKETNLYSSNGRKYSIICASSTADFDKYCGDYFDKKIRNFTTW